MIHLNMLYKKTCHYFMIEALLLLIKNIDHGNIMNETEHHLRFLRELTWNHVLIIFVILLGYRVLVTLVRRIVRHVAEKSPSHQRLLILRIAPIARLLIGIASIAMIVALLVEPSFEDIVALTAMVGLGLAFAFKDYASCMIAGVVTIIENIYQPGDWIEIGGSYGEVKAIGIRAVHIVTADDTEVIIPHSKLWSSSVFNASSGKQSLLCVTNFYLNADHDSAAVCQALTEIGETSKYRKPESAIKVTASESPWGTRYKLKAYVADSREQFMMITDLTLRGKEKLRNMGMVFAQASYATRASD